MNVVAALLMPLALASPMPAGEADRAALTTEVAGVASLDPIGEQDGEGQGAWPFNLVIGALRPPDALQVRIERQMTIRISPRAAPAQPNMLMDLPAREIGPRFVERKIGKCVSAGDIAGVQANGGNRLILYMRDRRIVSAELERACRARDFYSGFYLSRNSDGKMCVDRDTLLSRSGSNCKVTRMRQLVEAGN